MIPDLHADEVIKRLRDGSMRPFSIEFDAAGRVGIRHRLASRWYDVRHRIARMILPDYPWDDEWID